jgi:hypothetical protein
MKALRSVLSTAVLLSLSTVAFAQSTATPVPPSDAQKSFDTLKTLAGNWEGPVSIDPPQADMGTDSPCTSRCV